MLNVSRMDITLDDRLDTFQQISQRRFIEILDSIPGRKDLIIEHKLMKLLDCFIGVTVLRRHGVDKIFKMEQGLNPANTQRIFIVSCDLIACKRVLDQIQSEQTQSRGLSHHLLVAPLVPAVLYSLIEEEGLAGLVSVRSLSWELIRIDENVLSLEMPMFSDLYYHKDGGLLPALARSLWSLQLLLGQPKLTVSLGKYSKQTLTMMESMEESLPHSGVDNQLGALILMDRNYDLAPALLTPVTYLGLLSEVLEINTGTAVLGNSQTKLDPRKDHVYSEVRDRHFSDVFPILRGQAKSLKSEQEATQTMKLAEMERYVTTKLQKTTEIKRQLSFHISACEAIVGALGSAFEILQSIEKSILECHGRKECLDYIEKNIDDYPLRSLRLLSLLSITSDGATHSELQSIQKSHLHAHGYQNIPLFNKMANSGLLRYRTENFLHKLPNWASEWTAGAQRLKLLPSQSKRLDLKAPMCPSYVYSGAYIPAIAQLANIVLSQDTDRKSFDDLTNLPECTISGLRGPVQPKTIVLCIVGGITYGEISACRLVEKSTGTRIVLASDSLVTGNKLIETIQNI
ncbi:vacuolar protein sorting-associated protein 33B isoform X2 [Cephus cinctus]|nr:vacuolar protein sorting-associated protein 33B isoform X2 [Cephus cinctus]XP_015592021.1 vacuolar protein sorting-associated protein 33B isoform X2 [Cephus cinctus]XP_015592022.1 vacuolar protein sorting-associated protein 33B isoform X2 [Cephus cinctus]XP_015592023.1 vacuolar protein sorting-associated protein 33B isoform X2 [Cephus cinctus]XP_024939254.1 vacuolar protein sorting-associated protein 33B isoform X2 [Cephus cinctus]XP_024939255.1 vacuolar protein sorting-associated protein 3